MHDLQLCISGNVYSQCVCASPAPGDYIQTNEAELTFEPTTDRIIYQIPITRDDVLEAEENFSVQLSLPITEDGVMLAQASATVVVVAAKRGRNTT